MDIAFLDRTLNLIDGGGSNFSLDALATELVNREHTVCVYATHEIKVPSETNYDYAQIDYFDPTDTLSKRFRWISDFRSTTLDRYDVAHIFNPAFLSPIGYSLDNEDTNTRYVGRLNTYTLFCSNSAKMDGECHKSCGLIDKVVHADKSWSENLKRTPRYITQTYVEPKYVSNIDIIFAISPQIKKIYEEYGYKNNIQLVPNFPEEPTLVSESHSNKDKIRILYVGRLEPQKGVEILLQSLDFVNDPVHLDVIGEGSQGEQLRKFSNTDSDNCVVFHDYVPHKKLGEFYTKADLFVHPGLWPEPFGRTVLEALQYDCPVLVSNTGAPPWIAGSAGETFERGDPISLANKINYLCANESRLEELQQNCSNRVQKFSKRKIVDKIELLYGLT